MSRIQWEKAKATISSLYAKNPEWPHLSYFAHCPTEWPQHFAPVHLAHLQAPPIGNGRSHTTAWEAAIESAAGAGKLPNVLQPFNRVHGVWVSRPQRLGGSSMVCESQYYTKNLPGIAADDFQTWLKSHGETASEHIAAWFDAWLTAPASRHTDQQGLSLLPSPDWTLWAQMPKSTLREAVLLSLDLEPKPPVLTITQHETPKRHAESGREYDRRLSIASAHIDAAGPLRPLGHLPPLNDPAGATVSLGEFAAWAIDMGWELPELFPRVIAPAQSPATPAPMAALVESDKAGPLPVPTRAMADSFAGLHWNGEQWIKKLGNKLVWVNNCISVRVARGEGMRQWNPVLVGAYLVRMGHVKAKSVRARFQTQPALIPWLDEWKTYEADNHSTD